MGLFSKFRGNDKKENNFAYLEDLINSGQKEIILSEDIIFNDKKSMFKEGIYIKGDNITIDGNGHVIDAKGKVKMFTIFGNNISFKNILFKNGRSKESSAVINILKNGSLKVSDCKFIDNKTSYNGACFHNVGFLTLENCEFINNEGYEGSVINNQYILKIFNSKFLNNKSKTMGAIFNWSRLEIHDSIFENNTARDGAAIYSEEGILKIENSQFINNVAKGKKEGGGAIINQQKSKFHIISCDFIKNKTSINHGGAIYNNGEGKIQKSLFEENVSGTAAEVIFNNTSADLKIIDCKFKDNSNISELNMPIINYNKLSLVETDFISNEGILINGSTLIIENSSFKGNFKIENLAEIAINDNQMDLLNIIENKENGSVLICNSSQSDKDDLNRGNNHSSSTKQNNFTFLKELIENSENEIRLNSDIILDESEIANFINGILINGIEVTINGNGHYIDAKSKVSIFKVKGEINFKNITFKNGFSNNYGGAVYNTQHSFSKFENCNFENNEGKNGGAIYNEGSLEFINCTFKENSSINYGGAISNDSINIDEYEDPNINKKYVSVIALDKARNPNKYTENVYLNFKDCIFINNHANRGGVLYHNLNGMTVFENCDFENNYSNDVGGAIYNYISSISLVSSNFEKNIAKLDGGIIYNIKGSLNLEDVSIVECNAKNGGGICNESGSVEISSSTFEENKAERGGLIHNDKNASLTIKDSSFSSNSAGLGGAIDNIGKMCLDSCFFEDNNSYDVDGGVIAQLYGSSNIKNCKFENNSANVKGGVITVLETSVFLIDSIFENNRAKYGGVISCGKSSLKFKNCDFIDNTSEYGSILIDDSEDSNISFDNCTFEDNVPSDKGEIILKNIDLIELINCNFSQISDNDFLFNFDEINKE